jgi:hypothetical protein
MTADAVVSWGTVWVPIAIMCAVSRNWTDVSSSKL